MKIIEQIAELRVQVAGWQKDQQTIALVPTMGNLHSGHLALVEKARQLADQVVVSIFVNPLQFGPQEDFATYPRTESSDATQLRQLEVATLFLPKVSEMYPSDSLARVTVPILSEQLCGKSRPGHFEGVATVVTKLFHLVQPQFAIFGQKDFQQLTIIRQMVNDLNFPLEIIGLPTIRESDGLAMSSRNQYLSPEQRAIAPQIYQTLSRLKSQISMGGTDYNSLCHQAQQQLESRGFIVDYITVRTQNTLALPTLNDHNLVILVAAFLGKTRLIDNVMVT